MEIAILVTAFGLGFAARAVGLPPLVGYLVAGFALHAFGAESTDTIETIADVGILLLLFGIGLKLRIRTLARHEVWATASAFAVLATVAIGALLLGFGALGLPLVGDLDLRSAMIVGFALSFSSTVFAVKALERGNESASLSGRLAIGILILQDIFAVGFLVATADGWPSPWALLLVPAIVVLRPAFGWVLDRSDHGELMVLLGVTLAVGVGAGAFAALGLKADLGALVAGLMLSGHPRSDELADRLLGFKDLFLVGFFVSIGLIGTPPAAAWVIGAALLLLIPLKFAGFFTLLTRFRLRARTSLHTSLTLSTYSEFGLIVATAALSADLLDEAWVSTVAVAVAGSFIGVSWAGAARYRIYDRWSGVLAKFERHPPLPADAVIDCGWARVLIFGMGRVGAGAYDEMVARVGAGVVGVDRKQAAVEANRTAGRSVVRGDALDRDFWERVRFHPEVELVVAAMSSHQANLQCVRRIREFLPSARIASVASYPDEIAELHGAGVDVARNLYEEAGQALADDAVAAVWDAPAVD